MKLREVVLSLVFASAAGSLLFFSCGKDDGGDGDGTGEQTSEGKDVTQPFTLEIVGADVAIPAGAFEAGSKLSIKGATVPTELQANADVSVASKAIQLDAVDAGGAAIAQAKVPLTINLSLDPAATAGLDAVEKKDENLCVLSKGQDGALRVWRKASLAAVADGKVTYPAIWMGYYAVFYCGSTPLANFLEVDATGSKTSGGTGDATAGYSCQYTAAAGGVCIEYNGKANADATQKDATKGTCDKQGNAFSDTGCSREKVVGACSYNHGTTAEGPAFYYEGTSSAQAGAATLKQGCESSTSTKGKWFDGATYVATPAADQTPYVPTDTSSETDSDTSTNTDTPAANLAGHGCDWRAVNFYGYCTLWVGTDVKTASADSDNHNACTAQGGADAWSEDGCPTADIAGVCVDNLGKKNEKALIHYTASIPSGQTIGGLEASCGDPFQTWKGPGEYAPTPDADQTAAP